MLGDTLGKIAAEKAGIIKQGVPLISALQHPEAEIVIEQRALRLRAPMHIGGQQWQVGVERGRLVFQDENGGYTEYLPDKDGDLVKVRTGDGVHFDRAGGDRIAWRVVAALRAKFDLTSWKQEARA